MLTLTMTINVTEKQSEALSEKTEDVENGEVVVQTWWKIKRLDHI